MLTPASRGKDEPHTSPVPARRPAQAPRRGHLEWTMEYHSLHGHDVASFDISSSRELLARTKPSLRARVD